VIINGEEEDKDKFIKQLIKNLDLSDEQKKFNDKYLKAMDYYKDEQPQSEPTNQTENKQVKKTIYSKGIGDEEGKFFKTIFGKKEEITPERYNLENLERTQKTPTENEKSDEIGEQPTGQASELTDETAINNEPTSIKHADTENERKKQGLPQYDPKGKTKEERVAEGKRMVDEGDLDPEEFANNIVNKPRPLSVEEQEALLYRRKQWENRIVKLETQINKGELDDATITQHKTEIARLRDLIGKNIEATDIGGSELGSGLEHRKDAMNADYSKSAVDRSMQAANNGKPIDPKIQKANDISTALIADLQNKLADREAEIKKLNDAKEEKTRTTKRESLKKERESLIKQLHDIARKSIISGVGVNKIPVNMIVPLAKLAKNYVHDGILTLAEVVDKIHDDLQQKFSKDDIKKAIEPDFDKYLTENNKDRLDKSKRRLQTKLQKLKDGTYKPIKRNSIAVDQEYLRIKADIDREQGLINKRREKIELANKSFLERSRQGIISFTRNIKLFSAAVLGKLAATGLTTAALKIPEELIGGAYSLMLPKLAKGTELEGGVHVKALVKGYTAGIMEGMKDAYDTLNIKKGGKSNIEALYGKNKLPAEAIEFLGHLHSAIKAPFKRVIFRYSLEKRTALALKGGVDINSPIVQAKLAMDAYKDANRAIFMNNNALTKKMSMFLNEHSDEPFDKVISTIGKILIPFAKVSTNIALSTGRYVAGLPVGVAQLLYHDITLSFKDLKPEEKDLIFHNLKRGTLGGAALLMGFFNPKNVGGFYQPGEKRKDNEVKAHQFKIFGHNIPEILTEHPIYQTMQIGATFRRVFDYYTETGKNDANWAATLATTSGLVDGFSYVDESKRFTEGLSSPKKGSYFVGELAKGNIVPQLSSEIAKHMDTKDGSMYTFDEDNMQKRKTDDNDGVLTAIHTHIQSAIPKWRESLGEGTNSAEQKLSKIKLTNGDEYTLTNKQIEERKKFNDEFVKEHGKALELALKKGALNEKTLKEKIKERQKYWKEHNVYTEEQEKFKQDLINDYVDKNIQKRADIFSKAQMLKKYKSGIDEDGRSIYKLKKSR
jgi:hypothetical protein